MDATLSDLMSLIDFAECVLLQMCSAPKDSNKGQHPASLAHVNLKCV